MPRSESGVHVVRAALTSLHLRETDQEKRKVKKFLLFRKLLRHGGGGRLEI